LWLDRCDESIQHPSDFSNDRLNAIIVVLRKESHTLCDFQLNLNFSLRPERDVEMVQINKLPLTTFSFCNI
jgi:hypothetical protein